jgi:hypothetical protein
MPQRIAASAAPDQSPSTFRRIALAARAVADADPDEIETTARQLGESRRYLAPLAWAAGAIMLLVRGIKLLLLNWRLTLIELVPAIWVWLVMWDLRQHALRNDAFRQITVGGMIVLALLTVAASVAAFWWNTVFAFAITHAQARIAPAVRQARPHLPRLIRAGVVLGILLAVAAVVVPRIDSALPYLIAIVAVYALMLISFVAIPARILGAKKRRLKPKEAIGRWTVGGALSAVAMTPGFVLDRVGLILLGVPNHSKRPRNPTLHKVLAGDNDSRSRTVSLQPTPPAKESPTIRVQPRAAALLHHRHHDECRDGYTILCG